MKQYFPTCLIAGLIGFLAVGMPARADQSWSYTYNDLGLVETADGPRTDVNDLISYQYDPAGNLIKVTNPQGHITKFLDYNSGGQPGTIIDANGIETRLTYHARGWLLSSTVKDPGGNSALDATTAYEYNAIGQLVKQTLPDGAALYYEYDAARRLTAISNNLGERIEYELDAVGNRIGEVIKNSNGDIKKTLTRAFDELSRVMDITGAGGQNTHLAYDQNDNNTVTTNGRNFTTEYQFDALDRVKTIIDPYVEQTHFSYDGQGRLKAVTDAKNLTTAYVYDAYDNLVQLNSPDTGLTDFTYDDAGNRTSAIDSRGIIVTYTYDALNRLTSATYPNSPSENRVYHYDSTDNDNYGVGRLTGITDASGELYFVYNHLGLLASKTYTISGQSYVISYDYDLVGRLTSITYPSGRIVHYPRDTLGRVKAVTTQEAAGAPTQSVVSSVSYLPFGPISSFVYANGVSQQMQYDADYQLTDNTAMGSQGILDTQYGYDANSNINTLIDKRQAANSQQFAYDNLDRLSHAEGIYGQYDYGYDAVGNRAQRTHEKDGKTTAETYTYASDSHRLNSVASLSGNIGSNRSFTYDEAGNLIGDSTSGGTPATPLSITYNDANRPSEITVNSIPIQYTHNSLGQRTLKTSVVGTEHYHYNENGQLIAVTDQIGLVKQEYIYLDNTVIAVLVVTEGNNNAPVVVIQSPATGDYVESGSSVTFAAAATDPEEGNISSQILWYSSRDGNLGSGASITLSTLSLGQHVITARASNSTNMVGSAAITVSVVNDLNDKDGDNLPDAWEIQYFGNTAQSPDGDFDNDGVTNAEEYQKGTDPNFNNRANQLDSAATSSDITLSDHNTTATNPQTVWRSSIALEPLSPSKKYYWEATVEANAARVGIGSDVSTDSSVGASPGSYGWHSASPTGDIYNNGMVAVQFIPYLPGDRLMLAYDADAGKLWLGINGVWQGNPGGGTGEQISGITGIQYPVVSIKEGGSVQLFFSQTHFRYTPPTGFEASIRDDSDNDGLKDEWELRYFGTLNRDGAGDFDKDTFSDLEEFNAGSDPTAPSIIEVNLAVNKPAMQSSDYNTQSVAGAALDGKVGTITHTLYNTNAWWQVDLETLSRVSSLELFNRMDCCGDRLSNVYVFVSDTPFNSTNVNETLSQPGVSAFFLPGQVPASRMLAINRTARYIRVQLTSSNYLSLAEVVVKGHQLGPETEGDIDGDSLTDKWELTHFGTLDRDGTGDFDTDGVSDGAEFSAGADPTMPVIVETNLALNRPTSQSSTVAAGVEASVAVDGSTVNYTHTLNEANAWWEVDLETISQLSNIELFNRPDCCADRLSNVYVFVSDTPFTSTNLNTTLNQPGVSAYYLLGQVPASYRLSVNRTARYIRVQLSLTNYLSLAEVMVTGYPLGVRNSDTDSDSDGMADTWELQYFGSLVRDGLGDFDKDGVIDRNEFLAGTHPALPSVEARYWRLVNVSVPGSYLEPAEVEVYLADNTALNSVATISASDEPSVGLTQVVDGNLGTRGYWTAATAEASGFYLQWDFGAGNERAVAKLRQAGYDTADRYMDGFTLQYSDDGTNWTSQSVQSGLTYPGNNTYSVYYDVSQ